MGKGKILVSGRELEVGSRVQAGGFCWRVDRTWTGGPVAFVTLGRDKREGGRKAWTMTAEVFRVMVDVSQEARISYWA